MKTGTLDKVRHDIAEGFDRLADKLRRAGHTDSPDTVTGTPPSTFDKGRDEFLPLFRPFSSLFSDDWSTTVALPRVDVIDGEKEVVVKADLPGMEAKDFTVEFRSGALFIRGEQKSEKTETRKGVTISERSHGSFHRAIPIDSEVDETKIEASFKNGLLEVTLPKTEKARNGRVAVQVK